jgi:transcriptional regulator GlxA family with amidase domain
MVRVKAAVANSGATTGSGDVKPVDSIAPVAPDRIGEILEMIESDRLRNISEVAVQFNLSQSRLLHLFKQETGVGLGHLLAEQRLRKAALLLTHTRLRIKEIAAAVGYGHTSSFTRAFEKRFAQAPQAYRRGGGATKP